MKILYVNLHLEHILLVASIFSEPFMIIRNISQMH